MLCQRDKNKERQIQTPQASHPLKPCFSSSITFGKMADNLTKLSVVVLVVVLGGLGLLRVVP
jgi:hypothetical protein